MYLLISKYGYSLPVLYRLYKTGIDVKAFIRNVNYRRKLKGVISKLNMMQEGIALKPDVVVFDDIGTGNFADKYRSQGMKVFGGSMLCDKLFYDEDFCDRKMKSLGFEKKELDGEVNRVTFGIRYLDGKYVDCCAFFTTESYYPMEFGNYLEGMCTFGWKDESHKETLDKFTPYVERHKYSGIIYLQFMTNGKDLSFVKIFPYLNRDYFNCHASLYDNIFDLKSKAKSLYATTLRVTIAPYPFDHYKLNEYVYEGMKGIRINGIGGNFYPDDIMFDKEWQTAGNDGVIGDVWASGNNIDQILTEISNNFNKIEFPNKICRIDYQDFVKSKLEFFGLVSKSKVPKARVDYKVMYFNAVRKGTSEVIKVTRLLEAEGVKLSEVIR
jgi:hypothetical protein